MRFTVQQLQLRPINHSLRQIQVMELSIWLKSPENDSDACFIFDMSKMMCSIWTQLVTGVLKHSIAGAIGLNILGALNFFQVRSSCYDSIVHKPLRNHLIHFLFQSLFRHTSTCMWLVLRFIMLLLIQLWKNWRPWTWQYSVWIRIQSWLHLQNLSLDQ